MHRLLAFGAVLGALALAEAMAATTAEAQGIAIIVNAANPVTALQREQVSGAFLGKVYRWPGTGQEVKPVDQAEKSAIRATFSQLILGKTVDAVKFFWQEQVFAGRASPPPEKSSDADVVAFVRANPDAIGYVPSSTDLGTGVKMIAVSP